MDWYWGLIILSLGFCLGTVFGAWWKSIFQQEKCIRCFNAMQKLEEEREDDGHNS
ncbi:hypothetical protein Calow_0821 [Caldicellulosiruptor owensensis OL]|uniref:Uncharacterized protein n=1 Tax=Caldicellulosiruptor owensensis (strain ATCC 700167 / DSM 13100 / OL) TaxID=632518 RepID=E4Q615_CALOW|nr:hypothetical protein [Caldicellulosiruptor owensensis]ADQ04389.1 hypothetical protein Calow_0821 [Caldicellulosiruptor owensensis OL]